MRPIHGFSPTVTVATDLQNCRQNRILRSATALPQCENSRRAAGAPDSQAKCSAESMGNGSAPAKRQRAALPGRPPQIVRFGRVSWPDGAGRPGSRVDRRPASYSQEPAGRAGRDLAGPAAGRPAAWHIPTPTQAARLGRALQRRHRRRLRHRRSHALGRDRRRARAGAAGLPPPRGGRGRPRRGAAAATRAALRSAARPASAWRARIWFCAGIGSSSMRGMRGARSAGRSACGGMNGLSGSASGGGGFGRRSRPARGTATASARSAGSSRPRSR